MSTTTPAPASAETPALTDIEQLKQLADLRDRGILTDDEFEQKKSSILGAPLRRRRRRPSKRLVFASVLILLLSGGGASFAVKTKHDHKLRDERLAAAAAREKAEARQAAQDAAQRRAEAAAAARAKEKRAEERLEIGTRRLIVDSLQKSVTKDFEGRVADGYLDGPILKTSCTPVGGGLRDLDVDTGKYECLVATENLGGGQYRGYPVDATINYKKASYTWQLSN